VVVPGAARGPANRNVLDRFAHRLLAVHVLRHLHRGVAPSTHCFWSPEFEYAEYDIRELLHEEDRLREWMWTVPAAARPTTPMGEPSKEEAAATKKGRPP